jgi:sensor histidine kinase regulating citrate/malate metabolism
MGNVVDVLSGNAPIRVQIEADQVMDALRKNAIPLLASVFIVMLLAMLTSQFLAKLLFQ